MKLLMRLLRYARQLNWILLASITSGSVATFLQMTIIGLGFAAVAGGLTHFPWVALIVVAVAAGFTRFGEQFLGHLVAFKILSRFRNMVYAQVTRLAPAKLDGKHGSDLLKMVAQDIEQIEIFYAHTMSPVIIAIVVSLVQVVVLWFVNPLVSLVALCAYVVVGTVLPLAYQARLRTTATALSEVDGAHQRLAAETVHGLFELQQYQAVAGERARIATATADYWAASRVKARQQERQAMGMQLALIAFCAVFAVVGLNAHVNLMWLLLFPFSFSRVLALAALPGSLAGGLVAADHLFTLLDEAPHVTSGVAAQPLGSITNWQLDGVHFAYPQRPNAQILRGVTTGSATPEIIGLTGASGAGKSTLVKLLMRWYAADRGTVALNGTPVAQFALGDVRAAINYVPQTAQIFAGSVRENLTLRGVYSDTALWQTLAWVHLTDVIKALPEGLDTVIVAGKELLSAGEVQRLELARALLTPSSMLVLDEPTSNLDVLNEAIILAAVKKYYHGTVVIVTHRESTLAIAQRVLHLQADGTITVVTG